MAKSDQQFADAEVQAIDRKKAEREEALAKARRQEIESTRRAEAEEKARPAKPRPVPTAEELAAKPPIVREPAPEPAPLPAPDVSPAESDCAILAVAATRLEEAGIKAEWQATNDKSLGAGDRQGWRYRAKAFKEAAAIVRGVASG